MIYLLPLLLIVVMLLWGWRGKPEDFRRESARLSPQELTGVWRQATPEPLVGYLYFTPRGEVYYMASRLPVTEAMFTERFRVAAEYTEHAFSRWEYAARRTDGGGLLLSVFGEAISGTYYKV